MHCLTCGNTISEGAPHCMHCGATIANRCATCGTANPGRAVFCGHCGQRLVSQQAMPDRREEETVESRWAERTEGEEAERRQLTVLFCDLVGSTSLSERLDPEELLKILRVFQKMCSEVVARYGGHIAQYLGDGVLVYFGHPVAHEDDAQLAVRTALDIQTGAKNLSHSLRAEYGFDLSVRMGIHTGEVIVGREQLAVGETPNIAARAQNLAESDTTVMTADTHRLVEPFFTFHDLGFHRLKGLERQIQMYEVVGETGMQTRMQAVSAAGMMPLEGRARETNLLMESWKRARTGNGETVLIRGEAGIGKSRLIETFKEQLAGESYTLLECYCLAYDQHTAFAPISHLLKRVFGFQSADSPRMRLTKLSSAIEGFGLPPEQTIPLLAPLVGLTPDVGYTPLEVTPMLARQLLLKTLTTCLLGRAKTSSVVFVVEDLHWMDPSSLDLIGMIMSQTGSCSLLMLLTCRPEFEARWPGHEAMPVVTLPRLTQEETASLATHVAHNRTLPDEVLQEVVKRTDGVPLFVEELTKTILESGYLKSVNGSYELKGPLPAAAIPTTVRGSLMARLDRLGSAKALAQVGATIGRDFRHDVLLAVARLGEVEVERSLTRLIESDLVSREGEPPKVTYSFRHALIQEAAYKSLLESARVSYHERIAGILFDRFPEITENQPELLAQHYSKAGSSRRAVTFWQKAGTRSMERSANQEATRHFTEGLNLLQQLPDDESRRSIEVGLRVQLGLSLTASSGYAVPQVGEAYQRARDLCNLLGNPVEQYPALRNLCTHYVARDDLKNAKELAEQCMHLGEETQQANYLIESYQALGYVLSYIGDLKQGSIFLDRAVREYESRDGKRLTYVTAMDPAVASLAIVAYNRWLLGDPNEANRCCQEALDLADELNRPFDLAYAHCFAAMFHNLRYEFERAVHHADLTIDIAQRHGFISWQTWGGMQRAIAKGRLGDVEEAIGYLTHSLAVCQVIGAEICMNYFLGGLAEIYREARRVEDALKTVQQAIDHAQAHGELWYESALYRIRGELLALGGNGNSGTAEAALSRAIQIAQTQEARLLELQGALSLHKFCLQKGRRETSRSVLSAACESFPPDIYDLPDLQEARLLLTQSSSKS